MKKYIQGYILNFKPSRFANLKCKIIIDYAIFDDPYCSCLCRCRFEFLDNGITSYYNKLKSGIFERAITIARSESIRIDLVIKDCAQKSVDFTEITLNFNMW